MTGHASLKEYRQKRSFTETPEPSGKVGRARGNRFVVQEHHARRLHYDFRLEIKGVLKSWAVPKGPSMSPADKRLAIQTEDHPLEYGTFEGTIPKGHYGAGEVAIWDSGTFEAEGALPASAQLERGELKFTLHGKRLKGSFVLVRLRGNRIKNEWLLIKHRDEARDTSKLAETPAETVPPVRKKEGGHGARAGDPATLRNLRLRPPLPAGAKKAAMFEAPKVALATLAENPSDDESWIYEVKWDGIRTIACVREAKVKLWSRARRDITSEFPELTAAGNSVNAREAVLDGEAVVLDSSGHSDFQRLQSRMGVRNPSTKLLAEAPVVYYVFDILYCDGHDLRSVPLLERKNFLRKILRANTVIRYSDHQVGQGKALLALAREQHLEGIVGKQVDSAYPSGRTTAWLKFKTETDADTVIGGWTEPRGSREYFGALLLGLYDGDELKFVGGVGTGFTVETQRRLWMLLQALETEECPFAERPTTREKTMWVRPKLVARVKFTQWTAGGHLRQPRFVGLQEDRDPRECRLQKEQQAPIHPRASGQNAEAPSGQSLPRSKRAARVTSQISKTDSFDAQTGDDLELERELARGSKNEMFAEIDGRKLHFTNLNKIYFPADKIRKRHLLAYYFRMAPLILPFLRERPLVLRRYPNGIEGDSFFQKDADQKTPEWINTVPIKSEGTGRPTHYFVANDRATLLYLTNLGCIDHNPWSSSIGSLDNPDYIFFDLDPTPGTKYAKVLHLAKILMDILERAKLAAFAKTSGATGFHIFVPVEPRYTFAQARAFVEAVASLVDAKQPGLLTHERSLSRRPKGRIYLDAHQNSSGQSLASVYSVRAFPHAPVSAPVRADEIVASLDPGKWNLKSMAQRIDQAGDIWSNFWARRQEIESAVEHLERLS